MERTLRLLVHDLHHGFADGGERTGLPWARELLEVEIAEVEHVDVAFRRAHVHDARRGRHEGVAGEHESRKHELRLLAMSEVGKRGVELARHHHVDRLEVRLVEQHADVADAKRVEQRTRRRVGLRHAHAGQAVAPAAQIEEEIAATLELAIERGGLLRAVRADVGDRKMHRFVAALADGLAQAMEEIPVEAVGNASTERQHDAHAGADTTPGIIALPATPAEQAAWLNNCSLSSTRRIRSRRTRTRRSR